MTALHMVLCIGAVLLSGGIGVAYGWATGQQALIIQQRKDKER